MNGRLSNACLVSAALLLGSTAPLVSQGISVGAAASFGGDTDFGVGPRVQVPVSAGDLQLHVAGSFDYFFPGLPDTEAAGIHLDIGYWELNGNLLLDIPMAEATVAPYAGAGLNFYRASGGFAFELGDESASFGASDSGLGLNFLGGVRFGSGGLSPLLEARYSTGVRQVVLSLGVLF